MIITGWHVDGFGVLGDLDTVGLGPGLVLVHGPNEAGKSTLLAYLRWMLFAAKHDERPPLRGGRPGGRLFLQGDHGEPLTVERHDRRTVTVVGPDGRVGGPDDLQARLGRVDAAMFDSVFAFSLTELSRFETLAAQSVTDQIFSAGITGAGTTATAVQGQVQKVLSALLRPRAGGRINQLSGDLRETRRQLAEARAAVVGHAALLAREAEAQERAAAAATRAAELQHRERRLEALVRLWEPYNHWQQEVETLEASPAPTVQADAAGRMTTARAALARAREVRQALADQLAGHVAERDRLPLSPELEAVADRVLVLAAGGGDQKSRLDRLADLLQRLYGLGPRLAAALAKVCLTPERLAAIASLAVLTDGADAWQGRLDAAQRKVTEASARAEAAAADLLVAEEELAAAQAVLGRLGPDPGDVAARRQEVERLQLRLRRAGAGMVLWAAVGLAVVLGGTVLALLGLPVRLLWTAGGGVALAVAAAMGYRSWRGRAMVAAAARAVGISSVSSATAWTAARRRLDDEAARAGQWREADERRRSAAEQVEVRRQRLQAAAQRAAVADQELAALSTDFAAWRQGHGLPPDLHPDGVRQWAAAADHARELAAEEEGILAQRRDLADHVARFRSSAVAVLAEIGRAAPGEDAALVAAVASLADEVRAAQEARRRYDDQVRVVEDLTRRLAAAADEVAQAEAAHGALLAEAGAGDDAEYDRLATWAERWRQTERDAAHLLAGIEGELGGGDYRRQMEELLLAGDPPTWQAQLDEVRELLADCGRERDRALEDQTAARQEREALERSADVVALAGQEQALLAELADAVAEWRRWRLARELLDQTLERFVRDHQPQVLTDASATFAEITGGRYRKVVQGDDGRSLGVIDAGGGRLTTDQLSRGTQEQLYLSLRLGLARLFADQRAVPLPLVLDDVLVNFDPDRARATLRAFAGYLAGGERQVLLFTCHPETRALARDLVPGPVEVELGAEGGPARAEVAVAAACDPQQRAVSLLRERGFITTRLLREDLGVDPAGARSLAQDLVARGLARRVGAARGTRYLAV